MNKKLLILTAVILSIGVLFRILFTSEGNFIFHMDNARDMVDIREMVVLNKLRLTGPTSGIEGVYNGPGWYYLLAIPFIFSSGNPYALIIFQILLWAIGGYFLLKIAGRWGITETIILGSIWVASDLIILNTHNSLSPNLVILLMPAFIYFLSRYLETGKTILILGSFFLAALYFQSEMAFGVFMPAVIFLAVFLSDSKKLKTPGFFLGVGIFLLSLLPQFIFDLRHGFIMFNSGLSYLSKPSSDMPYLMNLWPRLLSIIEVYRPIYYGLMMNVKLLAEVIFFFTAAVVIVLIRNKQIVKESVALVAVLLVIVPFIGYLFIPMNVMPWHIQASMGALLILAGFAVSKMKKSSFLIRPLGLVLLAVTTIYAFDNLKSGLLNKDFPGTDPSLFKNETAAVDFAYQNAEGKNFKVYAYLPSIIDYPYQYLFWWYGKGKYGYSPKEYSYLPNPPTYISGKDKLDSGKNVEDSNLVFLIKQPDQRGERHLWENSFTKTELIKSEIIGSLIVEMRKE